jgi:protoheme IX farnesyltransferase
VLIIFVWTPPHFWALAIHRVKEYKKVNIPMLPVTHGIDYTKKQILLYTILLIVVSILPYLVGMSGLIYLVSALILGGIFLGYAININNRPKDVKIAWNTFTYSINYLMLIFLALLVDHYWLITL